MTARRPTSNWLGQHYDKLALVVVLAILLGSSLYLLLRIGASRNELIRLDAETDTQTHKNATPVDTKPVDDTIKSLEEPLQLAAAQQRLMVGELRVACITCGRPIPYNALVCPFDGSAQPPPGTKPDTDSDSIPDSDELAMGLNPSDPNDAKADLDGDLFSNAEEFRNGTDLKDPQAFPPPLAKLRVQRVFTKPFKLRFQGLSNVGGTDGIRYQLNLRSLEKTYFAKMGGDVEGFKVISYDPKDPDGPTLFLEQGAQHIALIQGKVIQQDQRTAMLVSLLDRHTMTVTPGDAITLKDKTYKVVDINESRVLIRDEAAGKDTSVGFLSDEERLLLEGGAPIQPVDTQGEAATSSRIQ